MRVSTRGNLIVETVARGVRVMRFTRPDLRQFLDDDGDAQTSQLFCEIQLTVLSDLPNGWTLVVNLALIDPISAAFYRCLLDVRKSMQARRGRLILCGLSPQHQEVFDLFRGPELFTIVASEAEARRQVRDESSCVEMMRSRISPRLSHYAGDEPRKLKRLAQ
jgi:anti-anti-sigma regulatory factor